MNKVPKTINGESYTLISDYKDNEKYRQDLNKLARKTYAFDFEDWYQAGYWKDRYRPYSLLHKEELVANVSANTLDYLVGGERKTYLQIGTVMTEETYRGKGLSRTLMEIVLKEYADMELIYLYANDSVLEFYPKFGFTPEKEYVHSKVMHKTGKQLPYRKLDMNSDEDRALIYKLVADTMPISGISMLDNPGLVMFYLTKFMRENIYYFEELKLAAVAEFEDDTIFLSEVFTSNEFMLEEIVRSLMDRETMKVVLGFTPGDTEGYDCEPINEEGSTFFIKRNSPLNMSVPGKGRFPVLSHA